MQSEFRGPLHSLQLLWHFWQDPWTPSSKKPGKPIKINFIIFLKKLLLHKHYPGIGNKGEKSLINDLSQVSQSFGLSPEQDLQE
jgi:hypothetical protein